MNKDQTAKISNVVIASILLLSQYCLANPVLFPGQEKKLMMGLVSVVAICSIVDFFVLFVAFSLISCLNKICSGTFLIYFVFVVVAGFIMNAIVHLFSKLLSIPDVWLVPCGLIMSFLCLSMTNLFLGSMFFRLNFMKLCVIAMLMGIFTNPYLYMIMFKR